MQLTVCWRHTAPVLRGKNWWDCCPCLEDFAIQLFVELCVEQGEAGCQRCVCAVSLNSSSGAAALPGPAMGDLEILAVLGGWGVGGRKHGSGLGVARTYRIFIGHAMHSVTLQFCNPFPFISHIPCWLLINHFPSLAALLALTLF